MKRSLLLMLILALTVSYAFADDATEEAPPQIVPVSAPAAAPIVKTAAPAGRIIREVTLREATPDFVIGKVECVLPSDIFIRTRSRITILDNAGNSSEFVVKALVVIYDASGKFLSLNNIQPGQEVQINYIAKSDGTREAASIRILK